MTEPIVPDYSRPLDIDDPADFEELKRRVRESLRRTCRPQVWALMRAGWTFELPGTDPDAEPWQWSWRRPPRREGRPGRRFPSTNQAYRAMCREKDIDPDAWVAPGL